MNINNLLQNRRIKNKGTPINCKKIQRVQHQHHMQSDYLWSRVTFGRIQQPLERARSVQASPKGCTMDRDINDRKIEGFEAEKREERRRTDEKSTWKWWGRRSTGYHPLMQLCERRSLGRDRAREWSKNESEGFEMIYESKKRPLSQEKFWAEERNRSGLPVLTKHGA